MWHDKKYRVSKRKDMEMNTKSTIGNAKMKQKGKITKGGRGQVLPLAWMVPPTLANDATNQWIFWQGPSLTLTLVTHSLLRFGMANHCGPCRTMAKHAQTIDEGILIEAREQFGY